MMCAKMGRPKSENPKCERIILRATKAEKELLEKCCELSGMTQAEVVIKGIRMVYDDIKK